MPDETQQLRRAVTDLHQALQSAHGLDAETRSLLEQTLVEVREVLSAASPGPAGSPRETIAGDETVPLRGQLSEAVARFEGGHPALAGAVRSVIDALAQGGI